MLEPIVEEDAINRALARIGVQSVEPFTTLKLGRSRSTEGWFALVEA